MTVVLLVYRSSVGSVDDESVRKINSVIINNSNDVALSNKSVIYYDKTLLDDN